MCLLKYPCFRFGITSKFDEITLKHKNKLNTTFLWCKMSRNFGPLCILMYIQKHYINIRSKLIIYPHISPFQLLIYGIPKSSTKLEILSSLICFMHFVNCAHIWIKRDIVYLYRIGKFPHCRKMNSIIENGSFRPEQCLIQFYDFLLSNALINKVKQSKFLQPSSIF